VSPRLVVLVSGNGSNLQALIDASTSGDLDAHIVAVVANKSDAYGLERATAAGIDTVVVAADGAKRPDYDRRLADTVAEFRPDVVVLAGWMRILTANFLDCFRVLNLHPALPGQFAGTHAIERAFEAWQQGTIASSGVMVHWVPDEGVDVGPVIDTTMVGFEEGDTLATFSERMHEAEHRLLVHSVQLVLSQVKETTR
jgi:phosphoribosylglycinamide formyltransferase-1